MPWPNHGRSTALGIPQCPLRTSRLQPLFTLQIRIVQRYHAHARSHAVTRKDANVAKAVSHLCWSRSLVNPRTRHEISRLGVLLVMMRLRRFTGKNVLTTVTTSQPEYRSPCHFGHPSTADSLLTRGAAECRDSPSPGKVGRRGQ